MPIDVTPPTSVSFVDSDCASAAFAFVDSSRTDAAVSAVLENVGDSLTPARDDGKGWGECHCLNGDARSRPRPHILTGAAPVIAFETHARDWAPSASPSALSSVCLAIESVADAAMSIDVGFGDSADEPTS